MIGYYGKAFSNISPAHCQAIRKTGGVLYCMLKYAFTEMADDYIAFFGYCCDKRAEEVDIKAGFQYTKYPKLLAHFHHEMRADEKHELIDKIYALGPF